MDSTNGHSKKNQQKKELSEEFQEFLENFRNKNSEIYEIKLEDLSYEEQESIKELMNQMGLDESPQIFGIDITIEPHDYDLYPTEFLAEFLNVAVKDEKYEEAEEIFNEIKNRGFEVEFINNTVSLKEMEIDDAR